MRMFLPALLVITFATGCNKNETGDRPHNNSPVENVAPLPPAAATQSLKQVWEEIQQGMRKSPDHTAGRAQTLVASKDPKAIFNFVRDEIAVYPAGAGIVGSVLSGARWGVRGTLRAGAGTPREQAELLSYLYNQAGFSARVVYDSLPKERKNLRSVFLRASERKFAPPIDETMGKRWAASLGVAYSPEAPAEIDPNEEKSKALTNQLFKLAKKSVKLREVDWEDEDYFPFVELTLDGKKLQLSPLFPDSDFDKPFTFFAPPPAPPVTLPKVSVELWAKRSGTRQKFSLVSGEWSSEDLVGRKLTVHFNPLMSLKTLSIARLDEVRLFLPTLSVIDSQNAEIAGMLGKMGKPVSPFFESVDADESGNILLNGEPTVSVTGDPSLVSKVGSLDVKINPVGFPDVKVEVTAKTKEGNPIEGLPPSAFEILEANAKQSAYLLKNRPEKPRILILYDGSGSLPKGFEGEGAVKIGLSIREKIRKAFPNAEFKVMSAGAGATDHGPWTDSETELAKQLRSLVGFASNLWLSLAQSRSANPTLTIYITDGASHDKLTEGFKNIIAAGTPVVALGAGVTGGEPLALIEAVAKITGGSAQMIKSPNEVDLPVFSHLVKQANAHRLSYRSAYAGQTPVEVRVKVGEVTASVTYSPPPATERAAAQAWSGLYLTVKIDRHEITRTLAGLEPNSLELAPSTKEAEAVEAAFYGKYHLAFEGAAPSMSTILDDILAENLSLIPVLEALKDGKEAIFDAYGKGFQRTPEVMSLLLAISPTKAKDVLTYETGLRVVGLYEVPLFNGPFTEKVDILPFPHYASVSEDLDRSLTGTLHQGVKQAVAEAALYELSTVKLLQGVPQKIVKARDMGSLGNWVPAELRKRWVSLSNQYDTFTNHAIMPSDGSPVAFWLVDEATATTTAILPDGTGGGAMSKTERELRRNIFFLQALQQMLSAMGSPYAPWVGLAIAQAKVAAYCTLMIENMDNPDFVPPSDLDPEKVLTSYACGQIDRQLKKALGIPPSFSTASGYFSMITGGKKLLPSVCDAIPKD